MADGKKGETKYYIIISLILGIMVLSLSLFFIFNEYFTGNDLDFEACRQSILLRANAPELKPDLLLDVRLSTFKDSFPLKCKTQVIEIDEKKVEDISKIIGDTMAECWALFDNGDVNAFPSDAYGLNSVCVPCARIHLTEEAKEKIGEKGIDIESALKDGRMTNEYSYWTYLNNSGKKFPAFIPGSGNPFDLGGESFNIVFDVSGIYSIFNRLTGVKGGDVRISDVTLSKIYDISKGDLLISYGVTVSSEDGGAFGDYIPYLFYFQTGQSPEPFDEIKKQYFSEVFTFWHNSAFCETWEGIPA